MAGRETGGSKERGGGSKDSKNRHKRERRVTERGGRGEEGSGTKRGTKQERGDGDRQTEMRVGEAK